MTDTPQITAVPMWARAIASGDGTKTDAAAGYRIRARRHTFAVYPDPTVTAPEAESRSMGVYLAMAGAHRGVWHAVPRPALVGWLHDIANDHAAYEEWFDDNADEDEWIGEEDAPPPPPNPTICRFLDTWFVPDNLRRFCSALPSDAVEWAIGVTPDGHPIMLARWGQDGASAGIVGARPHPSDTCCPVFDDSDWSKP